jgi:hypothetical protein
MQSTTTISRLHRLLTSSAAAATSSAGFWLLHLPPNPGAGAQRLRESLPAPDLWTRSKPDAVLAFTESTLVSSTKISRSIAPCSRPCVPAHATLLVTLTSHVLATAAGKDSIDLGINPASVRGVLMLSPL